MQVNSAQDYLTAKKRQIVSATYATRPPAQSRKYNYVFLSAAANAATQRQRLVVPAVSAWGSAPGGATYTSFCANCPAFGGAFSVTNTQGGLRIQDLNLAMSA